jgi:membrane associated rhomboid family serine protease
VFPIKDNIPTRRFPVVTVTLIAINTAVWLFYQLPDLQRSVVDAGWVPCDYQGTCLAPGPGWQVDAFTSMFMHGSWIHIIGNMLFLWIFGNNVEDRMGRVPFAIFYLAAGLAATATQTVITLEYGAEEDAVIPNVGASGAIAGVLGAYFLLFPHARVLTFVVLIVVFLPIEVPAMAFLGVWFLFQLWQGGFDLFAPTGIGTGGVAFFAHIGGFVFGLLVGLFLRGGRPGRPRTPAWPRAEL